MPALLDRWLRAADAGLGAERHPGRAAAVLLAPGLLVLAVFGLWPMLHAVGLSLWGGRAARGPFVGWANYAEALQNDAFWQSVWVTVYFVLGTVPVTLVLSFLIAAGLHRVRRGGGLLRTLYFLPYVTSTVAAALVWRALFDPRHGVANAVLAGAGVPGQQWLLEPRGVLHLVSGGAVPADWGPSLALCCIMLFDIWHGVGFMVVVFLAGLAAVPRDLDDAARLDGAQGLRRLRHVVLPLVSPTAFFLLVVGVIRAFQAFTSFYALTAGSDRALGTTDHLMLHLYTAFYVNRYWGYASAVAVLLSVGIMLLTLVQWRLAGRRVFYA